MFYKIHNNIYMAADSGISDGLKRLFHIHGDDNSPKWNNRIWTKDGFTAEPDYSEPCERISAFTPHSFRNYILTKNTIRPGWRLRRSIRPGDVLYYNGEVYYATVWINLFGEGGSCVFNVVVIPFNDRHPTRIVYVNGLPPDPKNHNINTRNYCKAYDKITRGFSHVGTIKQLWPGFISAYRESL